MGSLQVWIWAALPLYRIPTVCCQLALKQENYTGQKGWAFPGVNPVSLERWCAWRSYDISWVKDHIQCLLRRKYLFYMAGDLEHRQILTGLLKKTHRPNSDFSNNLAGKVTKVEEREKETGVGRIKSQYKEIQNYGTHILRGARKKWEKTT